MGIDWNFFRRTGKKRKLKPQPAPKPRYPYNEHCRFNWHEYDNLPSAQARKEHEKNMETPERLQEMAEWDFGLDHPQAQGEMLCPLKE